MAVNHSYEFHNFPKLAEESGFAFNSLRPRVRVDWNRIRSIDIESLIRDRKFFLIEQHISDILNCALESEFDVRILDQGVVKMFRLAQLALEYQQFCRQYLDRSIHVLREEITALVQELDNSRKILREREEEIKKLKRKSKHIYKPPLPYGNENIATMILKTLTNKTDVFPSVLEPDSRGYNRCSLCDKVFLNQLYLKSHMARRHPGKTELPEKESLAQLPIENAQTSTEKVDEKLNEEILQLKSKLQQMENMITNMKQMPEDIAGNTINHVVSNGQENEKNNKNTRDAEVSTNHEDYLLEKIEEWKKEEYEKYNKEINLLRTQILDTINSLKEKEPQKEPLEESNMIERLHIIVKQQGDEIHTLRQNIMKTKLVLGNEEMEKSNVAEAQMMLLTQRLEIQSKQYEALLQKLNEVSSEAQESRALAKAESDRAKQLQEQLQYLINNKGSVNNSPAIDNKPSVTSTMTVPAKKPSLSATDSKSLESLHRKAQELLNIASSSSDMSSATDDNDEPSPKKDESNKIQRKTSGSSQHTIEMVQNKMKTPKTVITRKNQTAVRETRQKKSNSKYKENGYKDENIERLHNDYIQKSGSPVKLVRAKITEEVNSRLVSIGIDPLKKSLPQNLFKKHRINLQQQNDTKSKKNPDYTKVKHAILTYLDANTSAVKGSASDKQEYISPNKIPRNFSIASVLSNVKSKALAMVKTNGANVQAKQNAFNAHEVVINKKHVSSESSSGSISGSSSPIIQHENVVSNVKHFWKKQNNKNERTKTTNNHKDVESSDSDHNYYNSAIVEPTKKSIESLIKSPARRPASANAIYDNSTVRKNTTAKKDFTSKDTVHKQDNQNGPLNTIDAILNHDNTSDEAISEVPIKKAKSVENMLSIPKTKGVLKNASSASSLSKKKVLFDMDAIQMKSVSASPSQSITEKGIDNEKLELGLINLDGEDWDISSIENEPLNNDTKIQVNTRTSPKITELKQSIEAQLAQRKHAKTSLVGGIDVLKGPHVKAPSTTGSNTSLGSSILDESDVPAVKTNAFIKSKRLSVKNDSDLDISDHSIDVILNYDKKSNDSF